MKHVFSITLGAILASFLIFMMPVVMADNVNVYLNGDFTPQEYARQKLETDMAAAQQIGQFFQGISNLLESLLV